MLNHAFDDAIQQLIRERAIALDGLTKQQIGDALGDNAQSVTYIPARDVDRLRNRVALLRDLVELILPMAIGYAAEHPVGNNNDMVEFARKALETAGEWAVGYITCDGESAPALLAERELLRQALEMCCRDVDCYCGELESTTASKAECSTCHARAVLKASRE